MLHLGKWCCIWFGCFCFPFWLIILVNDTLIYCRFVHFEDSEAVEKAISQFNDYDFNGSKLHVVNADRNNNPSNRFSNNSVQSPPRTSPGNFFQDEQKPSRPMGRGAQLLANVSSVGQSQERRRRPQAKVFGISPGTSEVNNPILFVFYVV